MFKIMNNRFLELNRIYKYEQFQENLTSRGTLIMQGKDIHSKKYVRNEIQANIAMHLLDYYKEDDDYCSFI